MKSQTQRINRVNQIKAVVKAKTLSGEFVSKEKFVARLCCDWGISRRTALEYLDNVTLAGYAEEVQEEGEKILKWVK